MDMIVKKGFMLMVISLLTLTAMAQQYRGNWDTYVMQVNQKPVSVVVDLDFGQSPVAKEKRNAILVRLHLTRQQSDGMPQRDEIGTLDSIENALVKNLGETLGATYTGRYTSDGVRTFYFYSNDTSDCRGPVAQVFKKFPGYSWELRVSGDKELTYYLNVLYPTPQEWERIKNRRMADALYAKGDRLTAARKVDHYLLFKTESGRLKFAHIVQDSGFVVEHAGKEIGIPDFSYSLHISRTDKVDNESIDQVSLFLWKLALRYFGKYDGWETFVVK